jgi:hypothetical protein
MVETLVEPLVVILGKQVVEEQVLLVVMQLALLQAMEVLVFLHP